MLNICEKHSNFNVSLFELGFMVVRKILCCFCETTFYISYFLLFSEDHKLNLVYQFVRLVVLFGIVRIIQVKSLRFWYRFLTSRPSAAKSLWLSGCLITVGAIKLM